VTSPIIKLPIGSLVYYCGKIYILVAVSTSSAILEPLLGGDALPFDPNHIVDFLGFTAKRWDFK